MLQAENQNHQAQLKQLEETNSQAQSDKFRLEAKIETQTSEMSTLNLVIAEKILEIKTLQNKSSNLKNCSDICEDNAFRLGSLEKQWKIAQENIKELKKETKLLEQKLEKSDSYCQNLTTAKRKRPNESNKMPF